MQKLLQRWIRLLLADNRVEWEVVECCQRWQKEVIIVGGCSSLANFQQTLNNSLWEGQCTAGLRVNACICNDPNHLVKIVELQFNYCLCRSYTFISPFLPTLLFSCTILSTTKYKSQLSESCSYFQHCPDVNWGRLMCEATANGATNCATISNIAVFWSISQFCLSLACEDFYPKS